MSYFCNAVVILFPEQIPCFKLADWSACVKEAQRKTSRLFPPFMKLATVSVVKHLTCTRRIVYACQISW